MTIIQYMSDIHADENYDFDIKKMLVKDPRADVLVMAGDFAHGWSHGMSGASGKSYSDKRIHKKCLEVYDHIMSTWGEGGNVIWCDGNHDFYHGPLPNEYGYVKDFSGSVFHGANSDIRFIVSPLFSRLSPEEILMESTRLSYNKWVDLRFIKSVDTGEKLAASEYSVFHTRCLDFISSELERVPEGRKAVVVTHHLPSVKCVEDMHKGCSSNRFFASDLDWVFEKYGKSMAAWIHGHSHSAQEIEINGVPVVRNPLGYLCYGEGKDFSIKTIEV